MRENFLQRAVEPTDHSAWRGGGRDDAVVGRDFEFGITQLGNRRRIRQRRRALRAGHRQRAYFARLDLPYRGRHPDKHQIDIAADHILLRGADAFIRHVQHVDAGSQFEKLHAQMHRAARTPMKRNSICPAAPWPTPPAL